MGSGGGYHEAIKMKKNVRKYAVIVLIFTFVFCFALALLSFCNSHSNDVLVMDKTEDKIVSSVNLGTIGLGQEKSKEIKLVSKVSRSIDVSLSFEKQETESVYPYVSVSIIRDKEKIIDNKSLSYIRGLMAIDKASLSANKSTEYSFYFRVSEDVPEEVWGERLLFLNGVFLEIREKIRVIFFQRLF